MFGRRLLCVIAILFTFAVQKGMAVLQVLRDSSEMTVRLDSLAFRELVVSGRKTPMTMQGDTLIFDVSSFYVPEGAKLRVLLERIPGIEVTTDGRILAQGKEVVRIKMNGKNFLEEGKDLALSNIPANILCEVKLYKELPDEEKSTGLHRSEGDQVLDVYTRPERTRGWMVDVMGAGGSRKRYQTSETVSGYSSSMQGMASYSADNQPPVFGIGESYIDKISAEANVNEVKRQGLDGIINLFRGNWEVNATAFINKNKAEAASEQNTEYYWHSPKVYSLGEEKRKTHSRSANASLDWSYTGNTFFWKTKTYLNTSEYEHDLYSMTETRETRETRPEKEKNGMELSHPLNSNEYLNRGKLNTLAVGASTILNKQFGDRGSNVEFSAGMHYTQHQEDGTSHANVYYTNMADMSRQVLESSSEKKGLRGFLKGILTTMLGENFKMQVSYSAERQYDDVDQIVNDLSYTFLDVFSEAANVPVDSLNKRADLTTWIHDARALLQYERGGWRLSGGVTFEPQQMTLHYTKSYRQADSVQTSFSVLPEFSMTYSRADRWNMSFRYMGRRKQPDLAGLLPIWDCTDPLHRYVGNAALRPENNHIFSATFFSFEPVAQRQISVAANAVLNRHTIRQRTDFDPKKGAYTIMPVNVDGNWNASCFLDFSTSFRNARRWNLEWKSTVNGGMEQALQTSGTDDDESPQNVTARIASLTTTHYAALQYKYRSLLVKPYAYATLASYRNNHLQDMNSDLWIYGWGGLFRLDFDFGLSFGLDFYRNSRQGYWNESMNGNEWICNMEISYAFLKNKALEVKLQGFDLLHEVRTVTQTNTVEFRRESIEHKGVNNYFLLSVSYHFDRFPIGS